MCLHIIIAIVPTQLNGCFYCSLAVIILFNIHLFADCKGVPHIDNRTIGLMSRVFANRPGDRGSILGWLIPKTLKMVHDAALLNTQQYNVRIKGKVDPSTVRSSAFPYTSVL